MGLFDKRKDKGLTEEQSELFRRLENEFNAFGANVRTYKCPNGCVDAIVSDFTGQSGPTHAPKCPKCGTTAVPL